jgi:Phage capsid family
MNTATANHRQRLQSIRERTHNARGQRERSRRTMEAARAAGDVDAQAVAQLSLDAAQVELETSEQLENMLLSSMAGVNGTGFTGGVFDDPQVVETLQRLGSSSMPIGRVDLGPLSSREDLVARIEAGSWVPGRYGAAGDVQVPDSSRVGTYYGTVPQLRRPLRLLDLIPAQTMDSRSFGYMQEGGSWTGAAEVAEGEVKPLADLTLTEAEVVASTIAAFTKLKKQQLSDVPALGMTVNQRLTYSVLRRLEDQILAGNGVGENILGILTTPGIGDVPFVDGSLTDLTLDGIVEVITAEATPNAVVLNPADLAAMLKATATGSGVRLDSQGAFASTANTIWDLSRITSSVIPQGQALVGDFANGATVFIREPVNVRLSDADSDDFTRNRLTALGEMRAGLAVWQPAAFCLVHLAATAPLAEKASAKKS